MPKIEKKAEEANSEPMIPLDDSGPAVDVELPKPKACTNDGIPVPVPS